MLAIENADISIVMQGGLQIGYDIRYAAAHLKTVFPGSPLILATQRAEVRKGHDLAIFDEVTLAPDPGPLPPVKFVGPLHNINRQIATSSAGLQAVKTPYAIKLRTDAYLSSRMAVELWAEWDARPPGPKARGASRIVAASFYTVNPRFDERVLYHVSDWFHFGRTEDLRRFWACPDFGFEAATWYERHPHAPGSLPRERDFRSKFATEQWLTLNYLFEEADFPIRFHNDCSAELIDAFEQDLVDNFIIAHPFDIGLRMPKHAATYRSMYTNAYCYSYADWQRAALEKRNLSASHSGYTQWPRTDRDKALYISFKTNKARKWLDKRLKRRLGNRSSQSIS